MTDLAALLEAAGVKPDTRGGRMEIEHISMDLIQPDEKNFYGIRELDELANSIATVGLLEPLLVRQLHDGNFKLVSGHRRFAAMRKLVEEGREDLKDIPCIVTDDEDEDIIQLKLIWGNLQRKKTDAEISQEAEQITALLYSLQTKGHKFPGRIRDHVANAVSVSTGKIAQLKYIRENLHSSILADWERQRISTAQADVLAHLPTHWQLAIQAAYKTLPDSGTLRHIGAEMERIVKWCESQHCGGDRECAHRNVRITQCAKLHSWEGLTCNGCCKNCYNIADCKFVCGRCSLAKANAIAARKSARMQEKQEQAAQDQPVLDFLKKMYRRTAELREARNIDAEYFLRHTTYHFFDALIQQHLERESGKVNPQSMAVGGALAHQLIYLSRAADLLGCSVDYLLGRTDEVRPQTVEPMRWRDGLPDAAGKYICLVREGVSIKSVYDLNYDNGRWSGVLLMEDDCVIGWMPMPKEALV